MRSRLMEDELDFEPKDVITFANLEKVKKGDKGYFGQSLEQLQYSIEKGWEDSIKELPTRESFCETQVSNVFLSEYNHQYYGMFLPISKVQKKLKVLK